MPEIVERHKVLSTPWFDVVAKTVDWHDREPYYNLQLDDYVLVVAVTEAGEVLLVRQYRPAVEDYTLELPSGHLEEGESAAETARRELVEETGYTAAELEPLGDLRPDTGRLSNRMWCFFAAGARPCQPPQPIEAGLEPVACSPQEMVGHILEGRLANAAHLGALLLAILQRRLALPNGGQQCG